MIKFSIGLPMVNSKYLKETLDSVASQTYKDFEIIMRNNAKDEDMRTEIRDLCAKWFDDPRVTYLETTEQVPLPENFNAILDASKGEFITFLSDDDIMYPDFLEEFSRLIDLYPQVDILHCRIRAIDEKSNLLDYGCVSPEYESLPEFLFHHLFNYRGTGLNCLWRVKRLRELGGYPRHLLWDADSLLWLKLGFNGIAATSKILWDYRLHVQNLTSNISSLRNRLEDISIYKQEIEQIIEDPRFQKMSLFPSEYLKAKNEAAYHRKRGSIIHQISKQVNLIQFTGFYLRNRGDIPLKSFAKSAFSKLSFSI